MTITSKTGIHIGDKTQIQGQSILPNNFNTINTIVNKPEKPIPPDVPAEVVLFNSNLDEFICLLITSYKITVEPVNSDATAPANSSTASTDSDCFCISIYSFSGINACCSAVNSKYGPTV